MDFDRHTKRASGIAIKVLGAVVAIALIAAVVPMFFGSLAGLAAGVAEVASGQGPGSGCESDDSLMSVVGSPSTVSNGGAYGFGTTFPSGSGDYWQLNDPDWDAVSGGVSVMVVFRASSPPPATALLASESGSGGYEETVWGVGLIPSGGGAAPYIISGTGADQVLDAGTGFADGELHAFLMVVEDTGFNDINLYADGVEYLDQDARALSPITGDHVVRVAGPLPSGELAGAVASIYEVRVWDRVLSGAEALAASDPDVRPELTDEVFFLCVGDPYSAGQVYDDSVISFVGFIPLLVSIAGLLALVGLILATVQLKR